MIRAFASFALLIAPVAVAAQPLPEDPLGSPMWAHHGARIFGSDKAVFDDRVIVTVPMLAENQHVLPVTIDARAIKDVRRIVLFADLNPIPIAIDYTPMQAQPFVATRIKLDQRTPVRAAVQTADGTWHVAGQWVDAAGGGCSAPPVSRVKGDWADHLGEMRGARWQDDAGTRVRVSFRHPMDTGLVENIPAYNIETLKLTGADGAALAQMQVFGSVSEDPSFTLMLDGMAQGEINVTARDTSGLEFSGLLAPGMGARIAAARQ